MCSHGWILLWLQYVCVLFSGRAKEQTPTAIWLSVATLLHIAWTIMACNKYVYVVDLFDELIWSGNRLIFYYGTSRCAEQHECLLDAHTVFCALACLSNAAVN